MGTHVERPMRGQDATTRERWITSERVQIYEGKSASWVKRHTGRLLRMNGPKGPNGKPIPLYDATKLSEEAQRRWLEEVWRERKKASAQPAAEEEATGQLALELDEPDAQAIGLPTQEKITKAHQRMDVIRPALRWPKGSSARGVEIKRLVKVAGEPQKTIYNWINRYEKNGLEGLIDKPRKDKNVHRKLTPAAWDLVQVLMVGAGNLSVKQAWREYDAERIWRETHADRTLSWQEAQYRTPYVQEINRTEEGELLYALRSDAQLPKLGHSTFRNYANEVPAPAKVLARKGPNAFYKTQTPTLRRDYLSMQPLEHVVMDHRELDIVAVLPPKKRGGEAAPGRPWITAAMDMRTRRWLGWKITAGPDTETIVSVIRQVLVKFGRPKSFYFDNGSDFRSHWLTAALDSVGVKITYAIPGNPRAKNIEANFRRLSANEKDFFGDSYLGTSPKRARKRRTS